MLKIAKIKEFAICLSKGMRKFCLLYILSSLCHADIAIILNAANKDVKLNRTQAQSIFLGTQTTLPNGVTVKPYDQNASQSIRQQFYQLVVGKNSVEMQTYWARLNFTGQGRAPTVLSDGSATINEVARNKNAIGYVDSAEAQRSSNVSIALLIPTR